MMVGGLCRISGGYLSLLLLLLLLQLIACCVTLSALICTEFGP